MYFKSFSNFKVSCGSYLYKGTLTFILLPLLNYDLSYEMSSCRSLLLKSFHMRCPDPGHFVTSQLQHFHAECPDPGHGTRNFVRDSINSVSDSHNLLTYGDLEHRMMNSYVERRIYQLQLYEVYSGFYSTSLLFGLCRQVRIFIWRCF